RPASYRILAGREMISAHTDVVGSLLRPAELLQAREQLASGALTPAAFKAIEDRAVDAAVRLQEDAGLEVVTDGEMRRMSFQSQLVEAVDGFGQVDLDAFLWGDWHSEALGDQAIARPDRLGVVGRLRPRRHLTAEEFTYLRARTSRVPKVTLASPGLYANLWSPELSGDAYPTLDEFLADVVRLYRDEVDELVRLGATYVQLDAPHYPLLVDPKWRAFYEGRGWSLERWLAQGLDLDNAVMAGHPGVTFGLHLCRGNQMSRWLVAGSYEPIARQVFGRTHAQRLLLEYDDERSGSFEALRSVPEDKMVVLGLVTTKSSHRETVEELAGRIQAAGRYVELERLALSPQCGFASSVVGNAVTVDDERVKLETIARTAVTVWR
ncbi:MAG TPA: cobalamin-independent methionine synthase II family protein, partial [Candidatus Dormibacteraeota bacterium]|nr:cobalamin-independent methionine synthase II family protein [Candidatus Dormibacteraeota bacterium]